MMKNNKPRRRSYSDITQETIPKQGQVISGSIPRNKYGITDTRRHFYLVLNADEEAIEVAPCWLHENNEQANEEYNQKQIHDMTKRHESMHACNSYEFGHEVINVSVEESYIVPIIKILEMENACIVNKDQTIDTEKLKAIITEIKKDGITNDPYQYLDGPDDKPNTASNIDWNVQNWIEKQEKEKKAKQEQSQKTYKKIIKHKKHDGNEGNNGAGAPSP